MKNPDIPDLHWEYGIRYERDQTSPRMDRPFDEPDIVTSWWGLETAQRAAERRIPGSGNARNHQVVRRLVGPVEVVE